MHDGAGDGRKPPMALVTATRMEMRPALSLLAPGLDTPERGVAMATVAGREVLLLVTGVGPVNAALELGAVLGRYEISGALNIGVAGSYDLMRAPLEAAVVADAEVCAEYGVTCADGLADVSRFPFAQLRTGDESVSQRMTLDPKAAARAMGLSLPAGLVTGTGVTVAGITGCAERADALASRHGALTESMEGFSLALGCASRGLPFLEVRTISNRVGDRDHAQWKLEQALAGLGALLAGLFSGPGPR